MQFVQKLQLRHRYHSLFHKAVHREDLSDKLQSDTELLSDSLLKSLCLANDHGDLGGLNRVLFSISLCLFDKHPSQNDMRNDF